VAKGVPSEDQSQRMQRLEQRVDQLEWRRRAGERSRAVMDSMVPEETRGHLRATGRESLLAVRSLLDYWIDKLDGPSGERRSEREKIPID
jgi:hypothetical protein